MRVRVLFEPDPDHAGVTGPLPEPRDHRAALRPMARRKKFEDEVALTGVGQSEVGRRLMVDPLSLTTDACLRDRRRGPVRRRDRRPGHLPGNAPAGMSEGGVMALAEALRFGDARRRCELDDLEGVLGDRPDTVADGLARLSDGLREGSVALSAALPVLYRWCSGRPRCAVPRWAGSPTGISTSCPDAARPTAAERSPMDLTTVI